MSDLSLTRTLSILTDLIRKVEESDGDPGDDIVPLFDSAVGDLRSAVDERAVLIDNLNAYLGMLKKQEDAFVAKRMQVEKALERIKSRTLAHLEAHPEIEFKGHTRRLAAVKPGGAAPVEYTINFQAMKDILDPLDVCLFPDKYTEKVTVYRLRKREYEEDFRQGRIAESDVRDVIRFKERSRTLRCF